ncbi:hypothetical protein K3495_g2588 [Podosphaera aphanis]|nr:hypothetical protein K3495_g2588 [Podosphaera aphanis]
MPLIVPETSGVSATCKKEEWTYKLVGKKIGDQHDSLTFAKVDLPTSSRVVKPGQMVTTNFDPNRLNIYVDSQDIVTHIDQR